MSFAFEPEFHSAAYGCVIWADEPTLGRVRFEIGTKVLVDALGAQNPVEGQKNLALLTANRNRVEAACELAFARAPSSSVELQRIDFQP